MAIGTKITVTIARTALGEFGGMTCLEQTPFNHQAGFVTTSTVKKNDIVNSEADSYVVTTNWASDDAAKPVFGTSQAVTSPPTNAGVSVVTDAISKINAAFPGTFS